MANSLDLVMQLTDLQHPLWCWAAVAASVAEFKQGTPYLQCRVATDTLRNGQDCCAGGVCNRPALLEDALAAVGHLLFFSVGQITTHATIRGEVDAGNPICVRVGWGDQDVGHFLAIIGYHDDGDSVIAADPQYGAIPALSLSSLTTSYQGMGTWTDTYFVY